MPPSSLRVLLPLFCVFAAFLAVPSAFAADGTGGTLGDAPDEHGGVEFGTPAPDPPVARRFSVTPKKLVEGDRPRISFRIEQPDTETVRARVVVQNVATGAVPARIVLGDVAVGKTVRVKWPRDARLEPGRYVVRVHVRDGRGLVLARSAAASGKAFITVKAKPRPKPRPRPTPSPSTPKPPSGTPSPSPAPGRGGFFPVRGQYTLGGDGSRFGADRGSHRHEGQDISAAEGTPVVAPVDGTVAFVQFQKGGAGWYVVINGEDGRSYFFAHLRTGSITVTPGSTVRAGAQFADVGNTGSSTGPHLHFEIWVGGWRDRGGRPIDPLPQLRAWAG